MNPQNNPPSSNTNTEQIITQQRPTPYDGNTQTLEQLVKQYGYRKTSVIIGRSRGYIWSRLRPAQAKIPRGRDAVKIFEVRWHREDTEMQVTNEPAILATLRQNLKSFLRRAEHIGVLSTAPKRKSKTMEAHLHRITTALVRLAMLHIKHAERATLKVPWQELSNNDFSRVIQCVANLLERITQVLAAMLLWRDPDAYQKIPKVYRTNRPAIIIYRQTLGVPSTRSCGKMTYELIAATNHTTHEQIKKTETKALKKLRQILLPLRGELKEMLLP